MHDGFGLYAILDFLLNLFGAETRIFWDCLVSFMAPDALAPCVTRTSAAMIVILCNADFVDFRGSDFKQPVTFQCCGMM